MSYIKNIHIKGLFGIKDINLNLKDVTVLVGKNGSGKSTILNIIRSLLLNQDSEYLDRCSSAELEFDNGNKVNMSYSLENKELAKIYNDILTDLTASYTEDEVKEALESSLYINMKKRFSSKKLECNYKHNLKVEFISTINLSANSFLNVTSSEGISKRVLDSEIEDELEKLKNLPNKITSNLCEKLNKMLSDSNKMMFIRNEKTKETKENNYTILFISKDSKNHDILKINDLSSGERQLIYILAKVANTNNKPTILLMDEPEISLHMGWQEKILRIIKEINKNCQILVVTHSPAIVMDGWMDSYIDINNIEE